MKKNTLISVFSLLFSAASSLSAEIVYITAFGSMNVLYIDTDIDPFSIQGLVSTGAQSAFMGPFGIATNAPTRLVYVTDNGNKSVYVIDGLTAINVVDTTGFPPFTDPILSAFTPSGAKALITDFSGGRVYLVDTSTHAVTAEVSPGTFARPIGVVAIDENTAFVADQMNQEVYILDISNLMTPSVTGTVAKNGFTLTQPNDLALSPDGTYVLLTDYDGGQLFKISTGGSPTVTSDFDNGSPPFTNTSFEAFTPDGTVAYITDFGIGMVGGNLWVVNPIAATVTSPIFMSSVKMTGVAVLQNGTIAYACGFNNTIYAINTTGNMVQTVSSGIFPVLLPAAIATFRSSGPSSIVEPPRNLGGSQIRNDFGLIFSLFNVLTWEESLSANVAGYNIYRNGVQIASVGSTTFQYSNSDIPKNSAFQYSVRAFNAAGLESTPVSVTVMK